MAPTEGGALAARLKPSDPDAVAFRALAAWKRGRAAEGLSLLGPQAAGRLRPSHRAYLRGRMLAGLGRCPEAIAELDRLAGRYPWVWGEGLGYCVRQPLMLLEAARCELALGRSEQAKARLDRLLAPWVDADPDLPALAEARALRASLERAGGAGAR